MNRTWYLIISVLVIAGMLVGTVAISTSQPSALAAPERPPNNDDIHRQSVNIRSRAMGKKTTGSMDTEVSIGEPGLSFRYVEHFGESEVPFFEDNNHFQWPFGVGTAGTSVWIADSQGYRALKYSSDGTFLTKIGKAGVLYAIEGVWLTFIPDVGEDPSGNIWILNNESDTVLKFDSSGDFLTTLGQESSPGIGNDQFDDPRGIAFDVSGNVYISDAGNHRVQIFDNNGNYLATIGEAGVEGSDIEHFNRPRHLTVDSDNKLYVADAANHRVQIFNVANLASISHVATLGVSGVSGSDNDHFNWPIGVAVGASSIYVVEHYNTRVQVFNRTTLTYQSTLGGSTGNGNYQFSAPADVAVDSSGNIYVADQGNNRVQQYSSSLTYLRTYGTTGVPYLTDNYHYNEPYGLALDNSENIILSEESGQRLIKLNSVGIPIWSIGEAGIDGDDNAHFNRPRGVAVNSRGEIYVADHDNHRIQIFNSAGVYLDTIGTGWGGGNYEFRNPSGVALGPNDYVYVADTWNHRIQIFDNNRDYLTKLGITGSSGSDNAHFYAPHGIFVDPSGNIYVPDSYNNRIQIFDNSYTYQRTLGTTGVEGSEFDQFDESRDVAVDSKGNIYVADAWNDRVQVYDANAAYLTTIAGSWGKNSGQNRGAVNIVIDNQDNVFISDLRNYRIQKFAPGVPGWKQVNINGFGYRVNYDVTSLSPFGNQLYAGVYNDETGAHLWRKDSSGDWIKVVGDGFGDTSNVAIDHLFEFDGYLYAGTWNETGEGGSNGGQIWRSDTGNPGDWEKVVIGGFNSSNNSEVIRFIEFQNKLYATTWNTTTGSEIWRSDNGDSGSWSPVISGGGGDAFNKAFVSTVEYIDYLYAGTDNTETGAEVWRSSTGYNGTWDQVNPDGFGDPYNWSVTLEPFGGYLYAATYNYLDSDNPGFELWRCQECDSSDWEQVPIEKGLGDTENLSLSLVVYNGKLYGLTLNTSTGMEVWRSANGTNWEQVGPDGLGDSNNYGPYWCNSVTTFNGSLFVGTWNPANGGEVWQLLKQAYLPLVTR